MKKPTNKKAKPTKVALRVISEVSRPISRKAAKGVKANNKLPLPVKLLRAKETPVPTVQIEALYGEGNRASLELPLKQFPDAKAVKREVLRRFKTLTAILVQFPDDEMMTTISLAKKAKRPANEEINSQPSLREQEYAEEVAAGQHDGI